MRQPPAASASVPLPPEDERGFTLIELLVGMAMGLVVLGATLSLLVVGVHKQTAVADRTSELQQARVAIDRLSHEFRQATKVTFTSASSVTLQLPATTTTNVVWDCSGGKCTRKAGTGATIQQFTGLTSPSVFSVSPDATAPTFVAINVQLSVGAGQPVVLSDGVELRNLNLNN